MDSLHLVFPVPDSELDLIRICHKSVADFFMSLTQCTDSRLYINPLVYNLKLGVCSLALMTELLWNNICDLPAYTMNEDIYDLGKHQQACIGDGLEDACRSWAKHLHFTSGDNDSV